MPSRQLYLRALSSRFCTTSEVNFVSPAISRFVGNIGLDAEISRFRHGPDIIDPFCDEMSQVYSGGD